jgi:hypothetical protein
MTGDGFLALAAWGPLPYGPGCSDANTCTSSPPPLAAPKIVKVIVRNRIPRGPNIRPPAVCAYILLDARDSPTRLALRVKRISPIHGRDNFGKRPSCAGNAIIPCANGDNVRMRWRKYSGFLLSADNAISHVLLLKLSLSLNSIDTLKKFSSLEWKCGLPQCLTL